MKKFALICLLCLCTSIAWSDDKIKLNIKPGQWQFTLKSNRSGTPMGSQKVPPVVYENCITQEDLDKGDYGIPGSNESMDCKMTAVTPTDGKNLRSTHGQTYTGTENCTDKQSGQQMSGSGTLNVPDDKHIEGSGKMQMQGMTNDFTFSGKWLNEKCTAK